MPWIGVDMDGTLAHYDDKALPWNVFGPPIEPMVRRIQTWLVQGREVRIITARVFPYIHGGEMILSSQTCLVTGQKFTVRDMIRAIQDYTQVHIGARLPCTCAKDYKMVQQWDDRAVQVIPNTGLTLAEEYTARAVAAQGKAQG